MVASLSTTGWVGARLLCGRASARLLRHGRPGKVRAGRPIMRIQEEAPLPEDPLATFESDYEMAVVHLAFNRRRGRPGELGEGTLLFAFVELLPTEIPPPNDDFDPKDPRFSTGLGGDGQHTVYVQHAVVSAKNARAWYLGCRRGLAVLPENGAFPEPEAAGATRLRLADLGEYPSWPTLLCVADKSKHVPFVPEWAEYPRMHHLIARTDFKLGDLWSVSEQERAHTWLLDHLHFRLDEYPEYWGSVHLMAPNPLYRHLHARRQQHFPPAESVLLRFEPRASKKLDGLELTYRGDALSEKLYSHTVPVQSLLLRMNFPGHAHLFQADVVDSVRGMLKNSSPTLMSGFIDIKLDVNIGSTLEVNGPTPNSTYSVVRSSPAFGSRALDTPKLASARQRLTDANDRRRKRANAARRDQRWFRGQEDEAVDVLRSLLHQATREVLIVDPYFSGMELVKLMLAVGREDIPVRILSSAEVLRKQHGHGGVAGAEGERLLDVLKQVRAHKRMNPFEIKVMPGKTPSIHDRFLLIDDKIWLLGSSLNKFGSSGTMMVALPDPESVREQLSRSWNDAMGLEAWLKRDKGNSRNGGTDA